MFLLVMRFRCSPSSRPGALPTLTLTTLSFISIPRTAALTHTPIAPPPSVGPQCMRVEREDVHRMSKGKVPKDQQRDPTNAVFEYLRAAPQARM